MTPSRRNILMATGAALAAGAMPGISMAAAPVPGRIQAIAFDGFPILDPRPVFALAKQLFGDKSDAFRASFLNRLFEYQWLRALGGQYKDFYAIIGDAAGFAADQHDIAIDDGMRDRFARAFLELKAWPDVAPALKLLREKGVRLAFLSNMTAAMLKAGLANSGLEDAFEFVLSTDAIRSYKPDPRAYQIGVDAFGLPKERIAFAAFAGWDAAGAGWFGYPTVWVNRLGAKSETLGAPLAAQVKDMEGLVRFVTAPA